MIDVYYAIIQDDCSHALSLANNSQLVVITEESCVDLLDNMKLFIPNGEV
jgi:hypothetical protein